LKEPLDYRAAGVDIEAGDRLVQRIGPAVRATFRPEVLGDLGGFGGFFALPPGKYREPVLVSGTDGVGTKLKIAFMTGRHDTVGIDLVAMCANDIAVHGAEPLFFLDYFATGRLDPETAATVIGGIAEGCRRAGCALLGGETAEMPGFYAEGEYDLAGFAVGVVERRRLIDGRAVAPGDVILGLASNGLHANGYALVRKVVFERAKLAVDDAPAGLGETLAEALLTPTRIYAKALLALAARVRVKGLAHVTGGGLPGNVPRAMAPGTRARIHLSAWPRPPIFALLQSEGGIPTREMLRTFNCGIGMVAIVAAADAEAAVALLDAAGETVFRIGDVAQGEAEPSAEFIGAEEPL
jgi:phosphoribosylformylglycinamidine cyclo-ligase